MLGECRSSQCRTFWSTAASTRIQNQGGTWEHLFQALAAAIYITDATGRIIFYNQAAAGALGLLSGIWVIVSSVALGALSAGRDAAASR